MTSNSSRLRQLLIVAAVLVAAIGMVAMPVLGATTTLAGDGSDEVTDYEPTDADDIEYSVSADGTDFSTDGTTTLLMNVSHDGVEHGIVEATVSDGTATSQTVSMNHSEFETLPGGAGETVNVSVEAWGENDDGSITTAKESFYVDITFADGHASVYMDDSSATTEEVDPGWTSLSTWTLGTLGNDDPADLHTYEQTGVAINGSDTNVTVHDATSNGDDAFDEAMDDDMSSGDIIYGASAGVDGAPVLAFYDEADTDIVNATNDTYAVYDSSSGAWTFNLGSEYDGASSVDTYVSSQSYTDVEDFSGEDLTSTFMDQADLGFMDLRSGFGTLDTFLTFGLMDLVPLSMGAGSLFAFGFAVSRRRDFTA